MATVGDMILGRLRRGRGQGTSSPRIGDMILGIRRSELPMSGRLDSGEFLSPQNGTPHRMELPRIMSWGVVSSPKVGDMILWIAGPSGLFGRPTGAQLKR